ncbi:MAG: CDP-alcohol phosphatidyltransferase family protein [Gammaproteobacteria bacterium]
MTIAACIIGTNTLELWGLDARERVARQLRGLGVTLLDDLARLPATTSQVLLIHADYLFEVRTFKGLLAHPGAALACPADGQVAAALLEPATAQVVAANWPASDTLPAGVVLLEPAALEAFDGHLRKTAPPLLEPLAAARRDELESLLYGNAYKGITDFVTKWWWPRPARYLVGVCARAGVTPNMVTLTGVVLMLCSCAWFYHGQYVAGLLSGWVMTLLDTVDGKLARVTVQSSPLGHVLDHGMDIIHPPYWYVLWGLGLGLPAVGGIELSVLHLVIVGGYIGGRLLEALFHALGRCSLFAWRPFDAYFRLFTARRNPCLVLLSLPTMVGRPDLGLLAVAGWTALSTAIMGIRLAQAALVRLGGPPLESWLSEPDAATRHPAAYASFSGTRKAYG